MRKLFIATSALLFNSFLFGQTPLTKIGFIGEETFNISSYTGNYNFSFTTNNTHYSYNTITSTLSTNSTSVSGFNDIDGSDRAANDTLSIRNNHYGKSDGSLIYSGTTVTGSNIELNTLPLKSIGVDNNTGDVYVHTTFGGADRYIFRLNGGTVVDLIDYELAGINEQGFDTYESITYFEHGGSQYLLFIGDIVYGATTFDYAIVNVDDNDIFSADINYGFSSIGHACYSQTEGLFYNLGTDIYKLNDIVNVAGTEQLDGTITYSTPTSINDITVNDLSGSDFRIFVATSDGAYTNDMTLNLDEKATQENNIVAYPNPSNGQFNIKGIEVGSNISILNSQGQLMYEQNELNQTDLNIDIELPNGLYFVKIQSNGAAQTVRMVINK